MNLRALRGELSLREAAKLLGISSSYLCNMETDSLASPPSEAVIEKMALVYEVDSDELCSHFGRIPADIEALILNDFSLLKSLRKKC